MGEAADYERMMADMANNDDETRRQAAEAQEMHWQQKERE
jgi:hypothetical protein